MIRYSAIALILLAASSAQAAEKTLDRSFPVEPGGSLTVEADGGDVRVSGGDTNQVVVHMIVQGPQDQLDQVNLEAAQKGNEVTVTMRREKRSWFSWGGWSNKQQIEVTVPRQFAVNVRTGGGSVDVRDTVGATTLRTSGGDVAARHLVGNIELRTSGGAIVAETDPRQRRCRYLGRRCPPHAYRWGDSREHERRQRALQSRGRQSRDLGLDVRRRCRAAPAASHDRQHTRDHERRRDQDGNSGYDHSRETRPTRRVPQWGRRADQGAHFRRRHFTARGGLNPGARLQGASTESTSSGRLTELSRLASNPWLASMTMPCSATQIFSACCSRARGFPRVAHRCHEQAETVPRHRLQLIVGRPGPTGSAKRTSGDRCPAAACRTPRRPDTCVKERRRRDLRPRPLSMRP